MIPRCPIQRDAPIPTWFRVGGSADRLAQPRGPDELIELVRAEPDLLVLGDGANLIVHDAGVRELVVKLDAPAWTAIDLDPVSGCVRAGAGVSLQKLVTRSVRAGLGGLEGLGGIPATVGGAAVMNAGGRFGELGSVIETIEAVTRAGTVVRVRRSDLTMQYRNGGLDDVIVTAVYLRLMPGDPSALRDRLKQVLAAKKQSQPMAAHSAGCCFKNPIVNPDAAVLGEAGVPVRDGRVAAGWLIDRVRCKGLRAGGATVSERHANFIITESDATARDVIELMTLVQQRVLNETGMQLEREVRVWDRSTKGPMALRSGADTGMSVTVVRGERSVERVGP